jgi:hypothetical protein
LDGTLLFKNKKPKIPGILLGIKAKARLKK